MGMEFSSRRPQVTKDEIKRAQEEAKKLAQEISESSESKKEAGGK